MNQQDIEQVVKAVLLKMQSSDTPSAAVHEMGVFASLDDAVAAAKVAQQGSTAEKELEKSIRNEDLLQLMKLQKTLVYFNTSIRGNEVMIGRLKNIFQDTDYL